MAVPKRRTSRSDTRHRRARWKASRPDLVPVRVGGGVHGVHRVPRVLLRAVERGLVEPTTGEAPDEGPHLTRVVEAPARLPGRASAGPTYVIDKRNPRLKARQG